MSGQTLEFDTWVRSTFGIDPAAYPTEALDGDALAGLVSADVVSAGPAKAANPVPADLDAPPLNATDHDVFFSRNSSELTKSDRDSLGIYGDRYIRNAMPVQITVDGYASVDGDAKQNQELSDKRAAAVKAFLSDVKGIKGELITATGHGATTHFAKDAAAPNRRAVFGPPIPDSKPEETPGKGKGEGDGGSTKPGGGTAQQPGGGTSSPQKATTQATPQPLPVSEKQLTDIFGLDLLAQWNAFRTKGGPAPPAAQLNVQFTLKGSLIPHKETEGAKPNFTIEWLDDLSISVAFNSSGPGVSDQEAINFFKMHWDKSGLLKRPVELSIAAVSQNLFTSDASPGVGGQGQLKVTPFKDRKELSVVFGGSFMLGPKSDNKTYNLSGYVGIDVTAF